MTTSAMCQNPRDCLHAVHGRLFQARMWRGYAMAWDGRPSCLGGVPLGRAWMEKVLRISREECLRRAWINARLARRLNRRARAHA